MLARLLVALLLTSGFVATLPAQKKAESKAAAKAPEGGWLKIPDAWLINRFVQSSVGPRNSYKVGLVLQPGVKTPKLTRSSGRSEVDGIAFDYAKHLVSQSPQLREMSKTKELVFNFDVIPPVLDAGEKSKEGMQPIPAGESYHTPTAPILTPSRANRGSALLSKASYLVVFPAGSGARYAKEGLVLSPGVSADNDLYYIRNAVLNWQTNVTSAKPIAQGFDITLRKLGFGGRFSND